MITKEKFAEYVMIQKCYGRVDGRKLWLDPRSLLTREDIMEIWHHYENYRAQWPELDRTQ